MSDINVINLTQETSSSLDGTENVIMFDVAEGKRATVSAIGTFIADRQLTQGSGTATITETLNSISAEISTLQLAVGSPMVAETVSAMTDYSKIYVYVGSETGYTNGNWYYWNGSAWTSGGVYNSSAVETDTSLSVSGKPADAKAVGDALSAITATDTNNDGNITFILGGGS